MQIRFAQQTDIDGWMQLVERVWHVFPGLETEQARQAHKAEVLQFIHNTSAICALQDTRVVGVLLFCKQTNTLCFLAVDPVYRRQHIADRLFEFMLPWMDAKRDITVITYRQGDPNATAARAFYRHLGFEPGELLEEFDHPAQKFVLKRQKAHGV